MPNLDSLVSFPIPIAGGSAPSSTTASSSRTPIPPATSHILVTDTLDSPASFVLVHFLRAALSAHRSSSQNAAASATAKGKARATEKHIVWLGCDASGLGHWKNLVRRSGVQLDAEISKGRFRHIDAASALLADHTEDAPSRPGPSAPPPKGLKTLYDSIAAQLRQIRLQRQQESQAQDRVGDDAGDAQLAWQAETLIVIDDLSALAWSLETVDSLGRPVDVALHVAKWIRALRALAAKHKACLLTLQHADATSVAKTSSSSNTASDAIDESIFRSLCKTADVWIEVKELGSGRARDCDGEITVHPLVRSSLAPDWTHQSNEDLSEGFEDGTPPLAAFAIETPCPSRAKAMLYRIAHDGQTATSGASGTGTSTGRVQLWARGTGRGFL
ncbi:uncharacterized protein PFL1_00224 [Pseudozyma flocculosa PF-1]|uniref:Elongator complex protein 5 n=1 Tax=Pseudozyma flocculosa TaxID=84751 RepID=A0A5C3ES22_9BASI|nr:uncharacterized protein PFL1_00224 [Pseudozyma flocculosa PF-1]EPQ32026.1 hypothetical protein PFL1_00224 [Pseudozyma flocculosa PF-1]SPO35048.1 uncharacterized protein PSFLO_00519 [Pseudozyma flocculosa]